MDTTSAHAASLAVAIALAAGMLTQVIAHHTSIPAILLLLVAGVLLGPDGLGAVNPEVLGSGLSGVVDVAVAVVLFEGGLNLNVARVTRRASPIRRLVTLGAVSTGLATALLTRWLLSWDSRLCVLVGALLVVTGPTVVNPLLKRVRVDTSVATVLEAEGVFIDAIGATLAMIALEGVLSPSSAGWGPVHLVARLGVGALLGLVGGFAVVGVFRSRSLVPDRFENVTALALAVLLFTGSNAIMPESGIAAALVAGIVVGSKKPRLWRRLHDFKEQLTVLLLGLLFVLLSADVRLSEVLDLGLPGLLVALGIVFVVRPIAVLLSTVGTELSWQQRALLAAVGPRGIIAAAVATFFATALTEQGVEGGRELRALVFLVIVASVTSASLLLAPLASVLGLRRQGRRGWVVFGANALGRLVARLLQDSGQPVLCVDSDPELCRKAEDAGLSVFHGNAVDDVMLARLAPESRTGAVALSPSDADNYVFAQRFRERAEQAELLVALSAGGTEITEEMLEEHGIGKFGGAPFDVRRWSGWIESGAARLRRCVPASDARERGEQDARRNQLVLPVAKNRSDGAHPASSSVDDAPTWLLVNEQRKEEAADYLSGLGLREMSRRSLARLRGSRG